MKNELNSNHLLDFISCLDFGLPQNYFNKELWSENSLSKALWTLDRDSNLLVLWKTILNKIHVTSVDQNLASDLLFLFVKKFTKKRCVTYLAFHGLGPSAHKDSSAIRQLLKNMTYM